MCFVHCSMSFLSLPRGWSDDLVHEAWFQDRHGACEKAGLDLNAVQLADTDCEYSTAAMSLSTKEVVFYIDTISCSTVASTVYEAKVH